MEILRIITSTNNMVNFPVLGKIVGAYLEAGVDVATASIFDAVTVSGGTELFSLRAAINSNSPFVDLHKGVSLRNGLSITLTGTSPKLYLMIE